MILAVIVAVRLGANVWRLWRAGERVEEAREELTQAQRENEELKKRLAEVQTPEFVEKEAKERLGLAREGEVIVIIPEGETATAGEAKPEMEPNWKQWWNLYFGKKGE